MRENYEWGSKGSGEKSEKIRKKSRRSEWRVEKKYGKLGEG